MPNSINPRQVHTKPLAPEDQQLYSDLESHKISFKTHALNKKTDLLAKASMLKHLDYLSSKDNQDSNTFQSGLNRVTNFFSPVVNLIHSTSTYILGFLPSSIKELNQENSLDLELTPQQKSELKMALKSDGNIENPPYKFLSGGEHLIIILNSLPNVVFKIEHDGRNPITDNTDQYVDAQLKKYSRALDAVNDNSLDLINIPRCNKTKLTMDDGKEVCLLAQEKFETDGDFYFQKGLYRYAFETPELQDYVEDCLIQLSKFICITGFTDVKFTNIPLLFNGSGIGLYDLDEHNDIEAFFTACTIGNNGLLCRAPNLEILEKLISIITSSISDKNKKKSFIHTLAEKKPQIISRIEKRETKRTQLKDFLFKNGIVSAKQEIDTSKINYNKDETIKFIQEHFINEINKQIKTTQKTENYDIIQARKIKISRTDYYPVVFEKTKNIPAADQQVKLALQDLKDQGIISHYKYEEIFGYASIRF